MEFHIAGGSCIARAGSPARQTVSRAIGSRIDRLESLETQARLIPKLGISICQDFFVGLARVVDLAHGRESRGLPEV